MVVRVVMLESLQRIVESPLSLTMMRLIGHTQARVI